MDEVQIVPDLIYDVGLHTGDDTAFYLHQGYRVVAIDADPTMVEKARQRFADEIQNNRLTLLNVGIATSESRGQFWVCEEVPEWSSFDKRIASRNGSHHRAIDVQTLPFRQVLREFGIPHYLKVDIEGNDILCVQDLKELPIPKYMSIESECTDDSTELTDLNALHAIGYRAFKLISQQGFGSARTTFIDLATNRILHSLAYGRLQVPCIGSIAAKLTDLYDMEKRHKYKFVPGSSGPWGDGTSGRWLTFDEARTLYLAARRTHFSQFKGGGRLFLLARLACYLLMAAKWRNV